MIENLKTDKTKENITKSIEEIQRLIDNKTPNPFNIKDSLYQSQKEETSKLRVEGTYREQIKDDKYNFENFEPFLVNKCPFIIGTGTFSDVYLYKNKIDQKFYAMKKMDKSKILELNANLIIAQKEIDIQSKILHPNILRLYNSRELKDNYDLILEYAPEGNLYQTIKKEKKGFSEEITFKFFIQALNSVNFLHENNIIHRDIKPENFLLMDKDTIKLCDFGWSTEIEIGNRTTFCGTYEYMAPEIINEEPYEKGVDVWALGVLLYELFFGYTPFKPNENANDKVNDILINILKNNIQFSHENDNNKIISEDMKDLILKMCDSNMKKRISLKNVFQHDWIKKFEYQIYGNVNNNDKVIYNQITIDKKINERNKLKDKDDATFFDNVLKKAKNKKRKRGRTLRDKSNDVSMDKSNEDRISLNNRDVKSEKDVRRLKRDNSVNMKYSNFTLDVNKNIINRKKSDNDGDHKAIQYFDFENKETTKNNDNRNDKNIQNKETMNQENNDDERNKNKDIIIEEKKNINKENKNVNQRNSDINKEDKKERNSFKKENKNIKEENKQKSNSVIKYQKESKEIIIPKSNKSIEKKNVITKSKTDINPKKNIKEEENKKDQNLKAIKIDFNQLNISEIENKEISPFLVKTPGANQSSLFFTEDNKQLTQEKNKIKYKKLSNEIYSEKTLKSSKTTDSYNERRNSEKQKKNYNNITNETFFDVLNIIEKSNQIKKDVIKERVKKKEKINLIKPGASGIFDKLFNNFKCQ